MNKLSAITASTVLAATLALAACNEPDGDTADLAPDAATADLGLDEPAGDGGAPEMANVQAAIDEECPALRARVSSATCVAGGLALDEFECDYSFAQDPEGSERTLTLTRAGTDAAWDLVDEPDFCGSLDRAAEVAGEPAEALIDTQPTD